MTAQDRIRLRGRLRKGPRVAGSFLFAGATQLRTDVRRRMRGFGGRRRIGRIGRCPESFRPPGRRIGCHPCETGAGDRRRLLPPLPPRHRGGTGEDWPPEPQRCPHCRLLIGAGRARSEPSEEPGARGSAAGVFAHQAKRSGGERRVSEKDVCSAIRSVAELTGARPERLLMVDYQQQAADDVSLSAADRRVRSLRELEARAPGRRRSG